MELKLEDIVKYIRKFAAQYPLTEAANKEKLEGQLLNLINKNENILTIRNSTPLSIGSFPDQIDLNLGMIACIFRLEKVALRALDNKEASLQQDEDGWNIGMWAADKGLENAVKKAIQNKEALKQTDKDGKSLRVYAAEIGIEPEQNLDEDYEELLSKI